MSQLHFPSKHDILSGNMLRHFPCAFLVRSVSSHAFKLFISNVHWLHPIDSTATVSTNISNYFCALWPKWPIELITNMVGISQSSCRFFISGCNPHLWWTDQFILLACGLFYRDSHFINQRFPFCKLQISILQTINIFPFHKLQISILQIISIFPCHKLQIFILFCFENYIKPFNSQDFISTCNSRNCLPYSSCDVS